MGPLPVDLEGEAGGAAVTVQGSIAEPQAGAGVELRVSAEGASLKALEPLAGTSVPDLGAYSLATRIIQEGVNYRLSELTATIAGIEAKGGLLVALDGPAPAPRELDLTLSAQGDSVAALGQKVGTDLPDLGAYKVAARISQQGQLFTLDGLNVTVGDSTIAGTAAVELVDNQPQPRDIDITINTHGESLADVGKLAGTDLPDLGPYKVAAHVSHKDGLFTIDGIDVAVAESTITGQVVVALVDNAPVPKSIDLRVDTHGESLADVGALVGAELPAIGPYVFATRVTNEKDAYKLSDMTVKMGGSDLAGEVLVSVAGARPSARGSFSSTLLDAKDFTGESGTGTAEKPAEGETQTSGEAAGSDSRYVLTEEPLPLEGLQAADADIKLTAGTVRLPDGLELTGVDLAMVLEGGKLSIVPLVATLAEGRIDGTVTLDGGASPPTLAAKVNVAGLDYGKLAEATTGEAQASGKVDVALDVAGTGASPRAIASGLDGSLELVSQQGVITNRLLKIVAVGLTDIMGPLLGGDDQARLNCLVTRFDIADGLATSKALVLDTEVFTVAGAGDIQLKSEQLDLSMDTATRQASLASLAIPFHVKGTMKEPQVVPDPMGAITGLTGAVGSQVKEVGEIGALIGQMTGKKQGQGGIGANPCVAALQTVGREYQGEIYPETEPAAEGGETAPGSLEDKAKGAVQGILDKAMGGAQPASPTTEQGAGQAGPAPSGPAPSGSEATGAAPSGTEAEPKPEDAVKGLIKGLLNN